jgi:two-component system chemotaxis response regulator CheB
MLDDGTAGLWALKRAGALIAVQELSDAQFPDMPANAIGHTTPDCVATASKLGPLLAQWVGRPSGHRRAASALVRLENQYARMAVIPRERLAELGRASSLICPDCHGPLWEVRGKIPRYRCHTGHAYSLASLLNEQREAAERTLSELMTLFDDEVNLTRKMVAASASAADERHNRAHLAESQRRAAYLRELLAGGFTQS